MMKKFPKGGFGAMRKSLYRKCWSLVVVLTLLLSMVPVAYAQDNTIRVQVNGTNVAFEVAPQMVNNQIMVQAKPVFEQLGATVQWDEQTQGITVQNNGTVVKVCTKSRDGLIIKNNAEQTVQLAAAPVIVEGRILVPVRFVAESLGSQVGWDSENKTVVIINYNFFLEQLKTKASNFYEYAANQYETINSGEVKETLDANIKTKSNSDTQNPILSNIDAKVNASFHTKLNPENGSVAAVIDISGLDEALKMGGLEGFDHITVDLLFDNNSFYVKSNLFPLLEKANIHVGDKWVKADIADLNIPDVKNLQDLKEIQSRQKVRNPFAGMPLDVKTFKETQAMFNVFVTLIDNDHFTVAKNGDLKVYKWNLEKADLVAVLFNLEKSRGDFEDLTVQDIAEMKKFLDTMVFHFSAEVGVKKNIIVSSKTTFETKMDIPDGGHFELLLKGDTLVLYPNSASFKISIPDPSNVIDFKDLQPDDSIDSQA